ncbi:MAG: SUMF1/EgtB/PvdO family nonheme iron enzyme [Polyangiaceae bacterium]|nr:SUMF1/EgtB/PvdO family nonheme iron enzyme [Polyangiaceae bacterium]
MRGRGWTGIAAVAGAACAGAGAAPGEATRIDTLPTSSAASVAGAPTAASSAPVPVAAPVASVAQDRAPRPCPDGMVHVARDYCPRLERRCVRAVETRDRRHICTEYERASRCVGAREPLSYCIDRYEYPNRVGAHPVGVANWYDAASTCASVGKRLCWEAEWTAACEGPEELPFPTGVTRDASACNIDLPPQMVLLDRMLARDPEVRQRELARVDRSDASGRRATCDSAHGVADLTGNFDEWVNAESVGGPGAWAALKGGSWIRSRNSCRAVMSGHAPSFRFHTLGFRCCADAVGSATRRASGGARPPPVPRGAPNRHAWPGGVIVP